MGQPPRDDLAVRPDHRADGPVDGLVDLLMAEAGAGKRDRGHRHVPVKGLHGKGVTGRHGPPRRGRLGAGASGRQEGCRHR